MKRLHEIKTIVKSSRHTLAEDMMCLLALFGVWLIGLSLFSFI